MSALPHHEQEQDLRAALAGGFRGLRRLPTVVEAQFRAHGRERAAGLLRAAIYGLIALYLLVVLPIYAVSDDPAIGLWVRYGMAPIGAVLAGFWACTRTHALDAQMELVIGIGLFACLFGTLYCAMRLDGQYFGKMAAYETIYILIVAFTILQLAPRVAIPATLLAFGASLAVAWGNGLRPSWLEMLLYALVPLLICSVTGFILEHSERRNFVQTQLLNHESERLARLHAEAEENMRRQRHTADYLALISGNLSLKELFSRTLRFLVDCTGAQVGVAYHLSSRGQLRRVASWAADAAHLPDARQELEPGATLMGPALQSGEIMQLADVRADYLPVTLGMGTLPAAAVLVLPIVQAGRALAVIELGKLAPFDAGAQAGADAIRTHLAYAVTAANAREIGLRAAAG
jgi:hypothetical protein